MAGANKRTSVILAVLAVVFVIIIIILCLVPQPCHGPDCHCTGRHCEVGHEKSGRIAPTGILTDTTTEVTTSVSTTTTTAPTTTMPLKTTQSTTLSTTTEESTTLSSTTEKSTTLSSTTQQSTTPSTTPKHIHIASSTTETSPTEELTPPVSSTTLSTTSDESVITTPVTTDESTDTTTEYFVEYEVKWSSKYYTEESTTIVTSSEEPTTMIASSEEPTTMNATSEEPTTMNATSEEPTTMIATSEEPTTMTATSEEPTTMTATSEEPTTMIATSEEPTTLIATSEEPTTLSSTEESTTQSTTSEEPTTMLSTTDDSTTSLSSTEPSTPVPFNLTETNETCNTIACKRLAARMLDMMHLGNIDPCEDFYEYSCGGVLDDPFLIPEDPQLITRHLIKDALARVSASDPDVGLMREYYDTCLNYMETYNETMRLEQAKDFFNNISFEFNPNVGGIVNTKDEIPGYINKLDLTSCLAKMMKLHFTPLFDLHLDVDGNDTKKFVLKLTPPLFDSAFSNDLAQTICLHNHKLRLENATLTSQTIDINLEYKEFQHCKSRGAGLQARLERMSLAVNEMKLMENIDNITLKENLLANTKINTNFFLESLADNLPKTPDMRKKNINKEYEEFTLAELSNGDIFTYLKDEIVWDSLLEELTGEVMSPQTVVQVYFKSELNEIMYLISLELNDPMNLQNILLLLWSERVYTDLVKPVGAALSTPEYCYRATTSLMEDFTSYLYLDALPNLAQRHDKVNKMIGIHKNTAEDQLKRRFKDPNSPMVAKLRLMSGETADIKVIKQVIQDNMKSVKLNDNFMDNSKVLLERYRTLMYKLYHRPTNEPQVMWSQFLLPYDTYGVTSYALNKFFIPYAALEAPLFFDDVPKYINYAGLGHMIAHEFAHGFDATGILYDGSRKLNASTPMEGINHFVNITECLKEQLEWPQVSTSVTGLQSNLTLPRNLVFNEVMADSAATRLTWEAYLSDVNAVPPQPTQTAPFPGGRNTVNRRKRWVKQNEDSIKREKRQASSYFLPSTDSPEKKLPWLNLTPIQTFFVRNAQNHCSKTSQINMLTAMENEHLPGKLRVNIILRNEPLFAAAFDCRLGSKQMAPKRQCPFILG